MKAYCAVCSLFLLECEKMIVQWQLVNGNCAYLFSNNQARNDSLVSAYSGSSWPWSCWQHQSVTIRKLSDLNCNFRSQWSLCCCMFYAFFQYEQEEIRQRENQQKIPEFVRVKDNLRRTQASEQWGSPSPWWPLSRCPLPSWWHVIPEYLYIHRPPSSVLSWSPAYIQFTLRYVCPTRFRAGLESLLCIYTKIWRTICFCCYGWYFLYIFFKKKYVLHFLINVSHIMTEGLRLEVIWLIDKLTCPVIIIH